MRRSCKHCLGLSPFSGYPYLPMMCFTRPTRYDITFVNSTLDMFNKFSGLQVNYDKSLAILIKEEEAHTMRMAEVLGCNFNSFPCQYLGLQLSLNHLTNYQWQPMLDLVKDFLPVWQRGLIARANRLVLGKTVNSSRPIHHLMVIEAPV